MFQILSIVLFHLTYQCEIKIENFSWNNPQVLKITRSQNEIKILLKNVTNTVESESVRQLKPPIRLLFKAADDYAINASIGFIHQTEFGSATIFQGFKFVQKKYKTTFNGEDYGGEEKTLTAEYKVDIYTNGDIDYKVNAVFKKKYQINNPYRFLLAVRVQSDSSEAHFTQVKLSTCYGRCEQCDLDLNCDKEECTSCNTAGGYVVSKIDNKCECLNTNHYSDENNFVCLSCHIYCEKCQDKDGIYCLLCNEQLGLQPYPQGGNCICKNQNYYRDDGVNDCLPCNSVCLTCQVNSKQCLTCNPTYQLKTNIINGKCRCQEENKYFDWNSQQCIGCLPDCLTCNDGLQCAKCDVSKGFLEYPQGTQCLKCNKKCKTCQVNVNNCIDCDTDLGLKLDINDQLQCECQQVNQYFDEQQSKCIACPTECQRCTATQCLDCDVSQGYLSNSDSSTGNCIRCGNNCKTCLNEANYCLTCNTNRGFNLEAKSGICSCSMSNQYYSGQQSGCQDCAPDCATCDNSTTCITCIEGFLLNSDSQGKCKECNEKCVACINQTHICTKCDPKIGLKPEAKSGVCECAELFYYLEQSSYKCKACNLDCKTCNNETTCIECKQNLSFLLEPDRTGICINCHIFCKTCKLSKENCTSCNEDLGLNPGEKNNECFCKEEKHYINENDADVKCKPCLQICQTCSDNSTCDTCDTSRYFEETPNPSKKCNCQKYRYVNTQLQECFSCQERCGTCSDGTQCDSCEDSRGLKLTQNKRCICKESKYYYSSSSSQCEPCNILCLTCKDSQSCETCDQSKYLKLDSNNQYCICLTGYVLINDHCEPCEWYEEYCQECSDQYTCTKCDDKYSFLEKGRCMLNCPRNQFKFKGSCIDCSENCIQCESSRTCDVCDLNHSNFVGQSCNKKTCSPGKYENSNTKDCQDCSQHCVTCLDADTCQLCDPVKSILLISNSNSNGYCFQKSCHWSEGEFLYQRTKECDTCVRFDRNCLTCDHEYLCTKCNEPTFLFQGKCITCSDGEFADDSEQQCKKCHDHCLTCKNFETCEACDSKATLSTQKKCEAIIRNWLYFNVTMLESDLKYLKLKLYFSEPAILNSPQKIENQMNVNIQDYDDFKYKVYAEKQIEQNFTKEIIISIANKENLIENKMFSINFKKDSQIYSISGLKLDKFNDTTELPIFQPFDSRLELDFFLKLLEFLFLAGLIVLSIFSINNFFAMTGAIQLISFILYYNIDYPRILSDFLRVFQYFNFIKFISIFDFLNIEEENQQLNKIRFERISTNFVKVTGGYLTTVIICLIIYAVLKLISIKIRKLSWLFRRYIDYGFFAVIIWIGYLTLLFGCFIQIKQDSVFGKWLYIIFLILALITVVIFPSFNAILCFSSSINSGQSQCRMFLFQFKDNWFFISSLLYLRNFIYIFLMIFLNRSPMLGLTLFLLTSILLCLLFILFTPQYNFFSKFRDVTQEIFLIFIFVCLIKIHKFDNIEQQSEKYLFGLFAVILIIVLLIFHLFFMIVGYIYHSMSNEQKIFLMNSLNPNTKRVNGHSQSGQRIMPTGSENFLTEKNMNDKSKASDHDPMVQKLIGMFAQNNNTGSQSQQSMLNSALKQGKQLQQVEENPDLEGNQGKKANFAQLFPQLWAKKIFKDAGIELTNPAEKKEKTGAFTKKFTQVWGTQILKEAGIPVNPKNYVSTKNQPAKRKVGRSQTRVPTYFKKD